MHYLVKDFSKSWIALAQHALEKCWILQQSSEQMIIFYHWSPFCRSTYKETIAWRKIGDAGQRDIAVLHHPCKPGCDRQQTWASVPGYLQVWLLRFVFSYWQLLPAVGHVLLQDCRVWTHWLATLARLFTPSPTSSKIPYSCRECYFSHFLLQNLTRGWQPH